MSRVSDTVRTTFGNRLRTRVCGLCFSHNDLLLVRHRGLGPRGYLYTPPGGGMHYGETAGEALAREFREETGLHIRVNEFLFVYEYCVPPLHALELFFWVETTGGILRTGYDPEVAADEQLIEEVRFMSPEAIRRERGKQMHAMINRYPSREALLSQRGYFEFDEKKRN